LQSRHVEPVECQSLQIADADNLRWQVEEALKRG